MLNNKEDRVETACRYASRGWHVFPIRPGEKTPLTSNGFKDASTEVDRIWEWWGNSPDANIAVATGSQSGLVVFDADIRPDKNGVKIAEELGVDSELVVGTPSGGVHYYFKHPGTVIKCRNGLRLGLDVKADGGYVLLPPSVVGDKPYRWLEEGQIPALPEHLLRLLNEAGPTNRLADLGTEIIGEGNRNDTLFIHGSRARGEGKEHAEILEYLKSINGERCKPPLSEAEVETIAQSCVRYPKGRPVSVVNSDTARVNTLAQLSAFDYERRREAAAKDLGVSVRTLDIEMRKQQDVIAERANREKMFLPVPHWDEPVDGAQLLEEIAGEFRKYCKLPDGAVEALSAWSLFTWGIDAFDVAPILTIYSPEKRCGKSTVLKVLQETVKNRLSASNVSLASLFRSVDMYHPTLLLDEADAWMQDNNELRGIVNAGHERKSATVMRTVGEDFTPKMFDTFCPKAIAGIGRLPDTIADRSIIVPMRRKLMHEEVARMRTDRFDLSILRGKCARWASDNMEELRAADPLVPRELNDRAQDNWRPLMAIADKAGGAWPQALRTAAKQLIDREQDNVSQGMMLLEDMRKFFDEGKKKIITTSDLILELIRQEERPWGAFNKGTPIRPANISRLLQPFGIKSKQKRTEQKEGTDEQQNLRGYLLADCVDAFERYLSEGKTALQRYTPEKQSDFRNVSSTKPAGAALRSATFTHRDAR